MKRIIFFLMLVCVQFRTILPISKPIAATSAVVITAGAMMSLDLNKYIHQCEDYCGLKVEPKIIADPIVAAVRLGTLFGGSLLAYKFFHRFTPDGRLKRAATLIGKAKTNTLLSHKI